MQKGAVKCCPQKQHNGFPEYFYGRYCLSLSWALLLFIYDKLFCLGCLELIVLSQSSNLALNGSKASPKILLVYEMCHQIHKLMSLSHFGGWDLCSQVHWALLEGIPGFCGNAVLAPPLESPRCMGRSRGQGFGLISSIGCFFQEGARKACLGGQSNGGLVLIQNFRHRDSHTECSSSCSLWHLIKNKSIFWEKCMFSKTW